jgi:hypothetical protein
VLVGTRRVRIAQCDIRGTNSRGTSADHEALSIASGSSDVRVVDNLSTGNAQAGLSLWVESTGTMRDLKIVNNTFAGNARGSLLIDADRFTGTNTLRNNVFADGPVDAGPFAADHNFAGNPGFADPARGDYHLAAGSAAIDAGSPRHAPAFDLDGVARPAGAGFDIGAYERRWP